MVREFPYTPEEAVIAFRETDQWVWDSSVIKGDDGKYHLFCSEWPKELGFGCNWLFNSKIIHASANNPEGPYTFRNVVLERRGREYFDGMNTHNTCVRKYNGKYYLYYMGTTYDGKVPGVGEVVDHERFCRVWDRKRIGVAVSESLDGPFVRRDTPLLEPRDKSHWDCTATTNPAVCILEDGTTYMIYKSRKGDDETLKLGVVRADQPDGKFVRLQEGPIFDFDDDDFHVEDPYLWYDAKRKKFCLIAKDDCKHGSTGITGQWGGGFYAESDDCLHFEIAERPTVYTRTVKWKDGKTTLQPNLERPSLLFDENGVPTHLFCASGNGDTYNFNESYLICMKLVNKE